MLLMASFFFLILIIIQYEFELYNIFDKISNLQYVIFTPKFTVFVGLVPRRHQITKAFL